jgi:hypothetical protein
MKPNPKLKNKMDTTVYLKNAKGEISAPTEIHYKRNKTWYDQEGYKLIDNPYAEKKADAKTGEPTINQGLPKPVSSDIPVVDAQSVRAQQMELDAARQVDPNAGKSLSGEKDIEPKEMLENYPTPAQINPADLQPAQAEEIEKSSLSKGDKAKTSKPKS